MEGGERSRMRHVFSRNYACACHWRYAHPRRAHLCPTHEAGCAVYHFEHTFSCADPRVEVLEDKYQPQEGTGTKQQRLSEHPHRGAPPPPPIVKAPEEEKETAPMEEAKPAHTVPQMKEPPSQSLGTLIPELRLQPASSYNLDERGKEPEVWLFLPPLTNAVLS